MIRSFLMLLLLLAITAAMIAFSWGREVRLTWNANPEPSVHYNLYRGEELLASTGETFAIADLTTGDAVTLTAANAAGESDPTPPLIIGPPPLAREGWIITASSEETTQEDNRAGNASDGNDQTIWHTQWDMKLPPHSLKIELPRPALVSRLRYLPRQDGGANGHITAYEVETSVDGATWLPATRGTWLDDATVKTADFGLGSVRFVRLWSATKYACAAEIWLHGTEEPAAPASLTLTVQQSADLKDWADLTDLVVPLARQQFFRIKITPP